MDKINHHLKEVLETIQNRYQHDPNVVAILVSGSHIHSQPNKNSDVDVHIIVAKAKNRIRGNTWINGLEVEYFINPLNQIRAYLKMEVGEKAPSTAHMFTNSLVLYQKNGIAGKLIKECQAALKKQRPKMSKADIELTKYLVDDVWKDLEDMYLEQDAVAFSLIHHHLLNLCLETLYKLKRVQKEKLKRIKDYLKKLDPDFAELFFRATTTEGIQEKFQASTELVGYIEKLLGGKRTKEWRYVSKCVLK